MDGGFVAAEESRRRDKPLASPSKCAGSPVSINGIAIDLNCSMEEIPSPKHEHFSILGYVSEMRKKDRKVCLPFASEGGDDVDLPPLPVPKFRWWQCSDCVPGDLDQNSTLGMIHADKSDAGTGSFHNVVGEKDSLLLQNIGDEHGSRDSMDYNYVSDKSTPYVWNNEGGNSFPHKTTEANQFQMKEITRNNSAAKNPSTILHEPKRASSPSNEDIALSSLPPKRKRKLRSLADIINKDYTSLTPTQQIEDDLNPHDYLEASSDAPKGAAKTPQRKRKMVLEEEEEEDMVPPIAKDKKLKGIVTESENNNNNTFNIVEISESESEKDESRPKLFGSRLGAKTRQNKARKQRSIDINRKARRADTENRTFRPMVNLQKYPPVGTGTNAGGMGSFFKKSLFGQQMDSIPDVSIDKRVDGHYSPYVPPSNQDGLGDCNNKIQEKVTLDLSLSSYVAEKQESSGRHTGIPDLNESFVEKVHMTEGLQLPTFPEKALHKNSDMFASSNKGTDNNNTGVVERGGTSDDIPMEIVELLAKNQHERALDDLKKQYLGSNGFHNNNNPFKVQSPYIEGTPSAFNFAYPNARSGLGVSSGTTNFLNFPLPNNCHSNISQFRQCSPLMPGQHKIGLCSGPNIVAGQRLSNGADLLWPPRRKNVTFDLGLSSGSKDQTYNGKNVKRAVTDGSFVREGGIRSGSKPVGSTMDAYSNVTIPAMQLLSLMDQRIGTGSSLKVGAPNNNFPNRQFSPCNEHPRPINKNHPFNSSSSFFGQSSCTNDFPAMLNGACYSGDSSKKYFAQGRMPPLKGNSKPIIDLGGPSNVSAQPWRSNLKLEVCTLNRNPADFSIPDARNEFTISAKDLKPKKRNAAKDKSLPRNVEEPKKQRVRKDNSSRRN